MGDAALSVGARVSRQARRRLGGRVSLEQLTQGQERIHAAIPQQMDSDGLNQSQGGIYMVGLLEDGVDDRSKGVGLSL
jgi:hypothetical protein